MSKKPLHLAVLGSTGSIGVQTLDVVDRFPDRLRVAALAADSNAGAPAAQQERYRPRIVSMMQAEAAETLRAMRPDADVREGIDGLVAAATHPDVDVVVMSV